MIDFVITWVDGSDPDWLEIRSPYLRDLKETNNLDYWNLSEARYRDWGLLRYWFRTVEKYTPWVRKIFFVTFNQIPNWLNLNNPKLEIVNHNDFIPERYLPTFNSHCIELNLHRIKGLSDRFVYFNDDMFIKAPLNEEFFF